MAGRFACVLLAIAPLVAGCGSGADAASSTSAPKLTDQAPSLVLQTSDLAAGFTLVPSATTAITMHAELANESAQARAADRRSWLGGYNETFSGDHSLVVSIAANYRVAGDAAISFADPVGRAKFDSQFHAHAVNAPSGAPGEHGSMRVGWMPIDGRRVPVRAYLWLHQRAIGGIILIGPVSSSANVISLARKQDGRMANLTAAGLV